MKSIQINRASWHFRLATMGGDIYSNDEFNFCQYFWKVVGGGALTLLLTTIGAAVAACVGDFLAWIIAGLFYGFVAANFGAGLTIGFIVLCILGVLEHWRKVCKDARKTAKYHRERDVTYVEPEPGFLKLAYRKFKTKTCFQINFVE